MTSLSNISEFFSRIDCPFQIYEMGRLVEPVSAATFLQFEQTQSAWPFPFMRQAWMAILFWEQNSEQNAQQSTSNKCTSQKGSSQKELTTQQPDRHYVWFLKFPLDEQAKLNLAARDDFLRQLLAALQHYLNSGETDPIKKFQSLEADMKDNLYGFTPNQERMANFHARVHQYLKLPPSRFYRPAVEYLTGSSGFEHWSFLGYQGLADVAARLDEEADNMPAETISNESIVAQSIQELPDQPLTALLNCLENHTLSSLLTRKIFQRVQKELKDEPQTATRNLNTKPALLASLIRASGQSTDKNTQYQLLQSIFQSDHCKNIEVIAAIAARCWLTLKDPELLALFLEALAKNDHGQHAFNAIISDLLFIPGMREVILQQFRSTSRSSRLAQAIGAFFKTGGRINDEA